EPSSTAGGRVAVPPSARPEMGALQVCLTEAFNTPLGSCFGPCSKMRGLLTDASAVPLILNVTRSAPLWARSRFSGLPNNEYSQGQPQTGSRFCSHSYADSGRSFNRYLRHGCIDLTQR